MNILICDDMQAETGRLDILLGDSGFDVNTAVFNRASDALDYVCSGAPVDVCFLDIVMPEMTGVELAEKLRANGYTGGIVFLTSSNDYASESYAVDAFSYLLKPTTPAGVRTILQKFKNAQVNVDTGGILVTSVGFTRFILFRDISHIEVIQHTVCFRLMDGGEAETYATFAKIVPQLLEDARFLQCHRSFVINMAAVSAINGKNFIMRCGAKIPISRSYPEAKKQYLQWMFGGSK